MRDTIELTDTGYVEYDNWINQNIIHTYDEEDDYHEWYEYDARSNITHMQNSFGEEEWYEYDINNNMTHAWSNDGCERWEKYDMNNRRIYFKNNNIECWYKYDDYGNMIQYRDSDGKIIDKEFDNYNKCIHMKCNDKSEKWYKYDNTHKLSEIISFDGCCQYIVYNLNTKILTYKNTNGYTKRLKNVEVSNVKRLVYC